MSEAQKHDKKIWFRIAIIFTPLFFVSCVLRLVCGIRILELVNVITCLFSFFGWFNWAYLADLEEFIEGDKK